MGVVPPSPTSLLRDARLVSPSTLSALFQASSTLASIGTRTWANRRRGNGVKLLASSKRIVGGFDRVRLRESDRGGGSGTHRLAELGRGADGPGEETGCGHGAEWSREWLGSQRRRRRRKDALYGSQLAHKSEQSSLARPTGWALRPGWLAGWLVPPTSAWLGRSSLGCNRE